MLANQVLEKNYEYEYVKRIQGKAFKFLAVLRPCKGEQPKEFDMYEIGKNLRCTPTETEYIVETLSCAELIRHERDSCQVAITTYGILFSLQNLTIRLQNFTIVSQESH
jgi:hypothetical protein